MKKPGKAKSSSRSKQPLSPAIAEVLSSVVTHEGSDDDHDQQGEQPFTTADGNGAKSARGGVTSGPPSTPAPVMVMDQDGVASFTSSILAALGGASGSPGSPSVLTGSNVGTGLVQPIGMTNLVQFEAGKSQASSLRRHLTQTAKMHFDELRVLYTAAAVKTTMM